MKMKKVMAVVLSLAMVFALAACSSPAGDAGGNGEKEESGYPEKAVTVIVPWSAGGGNDIAARELQPIFKEKFGVELVIENVEGGSSAVGLTQAIQAKPDGYTVGFMTSTYLGLAAQGTVSDKLEEDFDPLCLVMEDPIAIVCKTGEYESLQAFVEDAKSRPGESIIALSNTFGTGPTYCTLLNEQTGMESQLICYDSGSRCVTEVLGGHAEVSCSNYTDFVDQIEAGEMTCLAVCTEERVKSLPDVPTVNESGYDIFELGYIRQMSFMVAPEGMDEGEKETLSNMFKEVCETEEYQEFATGRSFVSPGTTGNELEGIVNETYAGLKDAYDSYFAK